MISNGVKLYSGATPKEVAADLAPLVDFRPEGMGLAEVESLLNERLLPHLMRYDRPHFHSMFNAFPEEGAKYGAQLALDYNQGVTNWQVSPGGAMLEELCGRALCQLFGLAETAEATFMYSGTYANQQAVYMAQHRYAEQQGVDYAREGLAAFADPARLGILVSEDAHFSLRHAARMLGLGEQGLIKMPVDTNRRVDVAAVAQLAQELNGRRDIFCVMATSGTTSTGSVDPLEPLADIAEQLGAWFHIDGAYGYAYKLVPEWRPLFEGDTRADSISWDPHKQMGVPIPNSVLFAKDGADFGRMTLHSGYFNREEDVEPNPGFKSPPTTRPFSALPLVTSILFLGVEGVVARLRGHLEAIQAAAEFLQEQPDFELMHRPDTGIVCFRYVPKGVAAEQLNQLQRRIYEQIMGSGERTISTTVLEGQMVLRLVAITPQVTAESLIDTIAHIRSLVQ